MSFSINRHICCGMIQFIKCYSTVFLWCKRIKNERITSCLRATTDVEEVTFRSLNLQQTQVIEQLSARTEKNNMRFTSITPGVRRKEAQRLLICEIFDAQPQKKTLRDPNQRWNEKGSFQVEFRLVTNVQVLKMNGNWQHRSRRCRNAALTSARGCETTAGRFTQTSGRNGDAATPVPEAGLAVVAPPIDKVPRKSKGTPQKLFLL